MDEVSEKGFGRFYETRMNCIAKYCHGYFFPFSFVCFSFFFFCFFFNKPRLVNAKIPATIVTELKKKQKRKKRFNEL